MTDTPPLATETRLELFAGIHPSNRQPIFEQVLATPLEKENQYKLLKSPLFVSGLAALDSVELTPEARGRFTVVERGGNLAIRVFLREPNEALEQGLTAEIEKLGGSIDVSSERALVYTIHFGVGFASIEKLLNHWIQTGHAKWTYGNVYHPETGEPLNWWQDLLQA